MFVSELQCQSRIRINFASLPTDKRFTSRLALVARRSIANAPMRLGPRDCTKPSSYCRQIASSVRPPISTPIEPSRIDLRFFSGGSQELRSPRRAIVEPTADLPSWICSRMREVQAYPAGQLINDRVQAPGEGRARSRLGLAWPPSATSERP